MTPSRRFDKGEFPDIGLCVTAAPKSHYPNTIIENFPEEARNISNTLRKYIVYLIAECRFSPHQIIIRKINDDYVIEHRDKDSLDILFLVAENNEVFDNWFKDNEVS